MIIQECISQKRRTVSFDSFLLARSVYAVVRYPPAGFRRPESGCIVGIYPDPEPDYG